MELGQKLQDLRTANGLTQEALAEKLYVTRQAVSRWENDETMPGITMAKKICELFQISLDDLLGCSSSVCQSCGQLLYSNDLRGTEEDGDVSPCFCGYCRKDGHFTQAQTVAEIAELNVQSLQGWLNTIGHPCYPEIIRSYYLEYLPTLQRWK